MLRGTWGWLLLSGWYCIIKTSQAWMGWLLQQLLVTMTSHKQTRVSTISLSPFFTLHFCLYICIFAVSTFISYLSMSTCSYWFCSHTPIFISLFLLLSLWLVLIIKIKWKKSPGSNNTHLYVLHFKSGQLTPFSIHLSHCLNLVQESNTKDEQRLWHSAITFTLNITCSV